MSANPTQSSRFRDFEVSVVFTFGFYVGLVPVVLVIGNDAFNAYFPNPWRLWVVVPAALCVALWCRALRGWRHD